MDHQLLNTVEVARLLGVHRWTVWNWAKTGELKPTTYVNGRYPLFDLADVQQLARERKQKKVAA